MCEGRHARGEHHLPSGNNLQRDGLRMKFNE